MATRKPRSAKTPWSRYIAKKNEKAEAVLSAFNAIHIALAKLKSAPTEDGPRRGGLADLKNTVDPAMYQSVVRLARNVVGHLLTDLEAVGELRPVEPAPRKKPTLTLVPGGLK